jgi:hypothetical protein
MTKQGKCYDCAQGILEPVHTGFALYQDSPEDAGFWYCLYCGSNHVTLLDAKGNEVVEQGNLYEEEVKQERERENTMTSAYGKGTGKPLPRRSAPARRRSFH